MTTKQVSEIFAKHSVETQVVYFDGDRILPIKNARFSPVTSTIILSSDSTLDENGKPKEQKYE